MSDDFDKNDDLDGFEWDDEPVNGGEDDDAEPGDLGFTGMLSWRQDDDDADDEGNGEDDLEIDWQGDTPPADPDDDDASPANLGFTGMLDWRQGDDDDADADDDQPFDDVPAAGERSGITGLLFGSEDDDDTPPADDLGAFFDDDDDTLFDDVPAAGERSGITGLLFGGEDDDDDTPPADDLGAFFDDDDDQPFDDVPAAEERSGITGLLFGSEGDDDDTPPADDLGAFFDDDDDTLFDDVPAAEERSGITGLLFGDDAEPLFDDDDARPPGTGEIGGTRLLDEADTTDEDEDDAFDDLFGDLEEEEPTLASNEVGGTRVLPDDFDAPFDDADDLTDFDDFDTEFDDFDETPAPAAPASSTPDADAFLASLMSEEAGDDFDMDPNAGYSVIPDDDLFAGLGEDADDDGAMPAFIDFDDDDDDAPDDFPAQPAGVPPPAAAAATDYDLDSLLRGITDDDVPVAATPSADDDALFSEFEDVFEGGNVLPDGEVEGEAAELLRGVSIGDEQASATALIRQRENRPEEELDERLYALRERAQQQQRRRDQEQPTDDAGVPGVAGGITAATFQTTPSQYADSVNLSREQRTDVETLRGLVAADDITIRDPDSAIRASADDVDLAGFFDPTSEAQQEQSRSQRRRSQRRQRNLRTVGQFTERLIVAGVLVAAVLAAYFGFLLFGEPPAANFINDDDGAASAVFTNISTIDRGGFVLFSVDYGPNSAAELDDILRNTLKHVVAQGGIPVIIGQNPIGVSRVESLIREVAGDEELLAAIARDEPLAPNADYYLVGFVPGSEAGLRNLVQDPAATLATDIRGEATGLDIPSLDDFALITVLADTPDDVRFWAEQVAPSTTTPIVGGVARVTEILARQYYLAPDGFEGLLVGQPDANIYDNLLTDLVFVQAAEIAALPTNTPTLTFTPSRTPTLTPIGFVASPTPAGFVPSETPAGFEPVVVFGVGAFVVSDGGTLNVRQEPTTASPVVGTLAPNTAVRVQGEDGTGEWTQVIFRDGTQGWVSTALLRRAEPDQIDAEQTAIADIASALTPTATETPTPTITPSPTATATATAAPPDTETPTATAAATEPTVTLEEGEGLGAVLVDDVDVYPTPNTTVAPVTTLGAGELVAIRAIRPGANGVTFAEVRLDDGTIGFVQQTNLSIRQFPDNAETLPQGTPGATEDIEVVVVPTATATDAGATAAPTNTPTVTPTPTNTPTPTPIPDFLDEGTVVRTLPQTTINARSGPGTTFDRVDTIRPASRLLVVGNSDDGQWLEVQLPTGGTGFVFRQLVTIDPDNTPPTLAPSATVPPTLTPTVTRTPSPTPIPLDAEGLVAEVTARRALNIRSGPGRGFQSLGPLEPGTVVNVLGPSEDQQWIEIQLPDGRTGFVVVGGVNLIPGDTYLRNATATAEAGGQAFPLAAVTTATVLPTVAPDPTSTGTFVPGRVQLPPGTRATVRGIDRVNVRANPTRFTPVIAILNGREQVEALTISANENWVQVRRVTGEIGWVSRPLLSLALPTTVTPGPSATLPPGVTPSATPAVTVTAATAPTDAATEPPTNTPAPTATDTPPPTTPPTATPTPTVDPFQDSSLPGGRMVYGRVAAPAPRARQQEPAGTIAGDTPVQVRAGAGLFFESLGTALPGDPVTVLGTSDDGTWTQVRLADGTEGFVQSAQVTTGDTLAGGAAQPGSGTVREDFTQVVSAPNAASDMVTTLDAGTTVTIVAVIGDYAEITLDAAPAFLLTSALEITAFPASDANAGAATVFVDADVNVQAAPDVDSAVVGTTTVGAAVAVLGLETAADGTQWASIQLADGTEGFVLAEQLRITDFAFQQAAAPAEAERARVVATGTVNVRSGPSLAFGVVGAAEPGDELPVLATTTTADEGEWVQVELADGTQGFLQAGTVELVTGAVAAAPSPTPAGAVAGIGTGTVSTGFPVNVRSGPGVFFQIIATVEPGDTFPVIGPADTPDWFEIALADGTTGFVPANEIIVAAAPAAPTATPTEADAPTATATATPTEADAPTETATATPTEADAPTATASPLPPAAAEGSGVIVAGGTVNVRATPSLGAAVVGVASGGETLPVLAIAETTDEGNWVQVRLADGSVGFVQADAISISDFAFLPTPEPTLTPTTLQVADGVGFGTINAENTVNVRAGPSAAFSVVAGGDPDTPVAIIEQAQTEGEGDWLRIRLPDGTEGWVAAFLVDVEAAPGAAPTTVAGASTPTATPTPTASPTTPPEPSPTATDAPPTDTPPPTAAEAATASTGAGEINASATINVRGGPGLAFNVVGAADPGQAVDVLAFAEGDDGSAWVRIRVPGGAEGFIQAEQITITVLPPFDTGADAPTEVAALPSATPTDAPTEVAALPTATPTDTPTEVAVLPTATPTDTPTEVAVLPTATHTDAPTEVAQEPTAAPVAQVGAGVVIAGGPVNVRSGPGLAFDAIGTVQPDETVVVLAFAEGDDGDNWLQIQLTDGTAGFVEAAQVNITALPPLTAGTTTPTATDAPATTTPTSSPSPEAEAGGTAVALAPDARNPVIGPFYSQQAGDVQLTAARREVAVRVGLVVSALLIALGNLFYALARREK